MNAFKVLWLVILGYYFPLLLNSNDSVAHKNAHLKTVFLNKRILITGAGGSIGSEICRVVALFSPSELILLDNNEYFLWKIRIELSEKFPHLNFTIFLADVSSFARIENIFQEKKPHIVFHAAALKHVKMVEENPCEGFLTNVIGTKNLSEAALRHDIEKFIFLSTDKAVNPSSRMGASKRIAELWLQSLQANSQQTVFNILRFGNVYGSVGSVIPLFRHQISQGGPLTLTHESVSRYFITHEKAVMGLLEVCFQSELRQQTCTNMLYILEMGQPVKIMDLAKNLLMHSGQKDNIEIKIVGLAKGEKIEEALLYDDESQESILGTDLLAVHSKRQIVNLESIKNHLEKIEQACRQSDAGELLKITLKMLPEFSCSETYVGD
ncbi:polysaccharide biosynthesis protein [Acetobacteraceae bacterium]|nr:polysaccharide biosynthesis protein [Acetobacteraceae bacterium]